MKTPQGVRLLSTVSAAVLLFLSACTSPNDAGKDVLPDDDQVQGFYVDTFTIEMRTLLLDSTQTYNLSRTLVGNYVDEEFGHIYAETYFQPRVTGSNLTFGADPARLTLDSIVLTVDLLDFYGRFSDPIPLQIYEITEAFPTDSSLYSRSRLDADTTLDLANGYKLDFSGQAGFFDQVKIRLADSLGRKILFADPADLANNSVFTDFFKGLYLRSTAVNQSISREPGGIFAIDPRSEKTFLTLHYHDSTARKSVNFPVSASSERFSRIVRTDFGSRLVSDAVAASGSPAAEYACLQAGALVNMYIGIPGIKSLDPAIINRATLVLKVDPDHLGSGERFEPPSEIFVQISDSNKRAAIDADAIVSRVSYSGITDEYRIPMTNTLQQVLAGRFEDNGFIIVPGENGITLNRAVIGGPGHPTLAPRLEVIYTTVPK